MHVAIEGLEGVALDAHPLVQRGRGRDVDPVEPIEVGVSEIAVRLHGLVAGRAADVVQLAGEDLRADLRHPARVDAAGEHRREGVVAPLASEVLRIPDRHLPNSPITRCNAIHGSTVSMPQARLRVSTMAFLVELG